MRQTMLTVLVAALSFVAMTAQTPTVPFPDGYRDWRHVKSMVIAQGHPLFEAFGGIHHIYANDLALKGYASGKFPDGSIIVFDLLEAHTKDNATTEGARKVLGVMHKDSKRWPATHLAKKSRLRVQQSALAGSHSRPSAFIESVPQTRLRFAAPARTCSRAPCLT